MELWMVVMIIALLGVLFAIKTVVTGQNQPTPAQPVAAPSRSPFKYEVAGAGIIEASTENIAIGTPVGNIVTEIFVKIGDKVKAGNPLFRLRDTVTLAELEVRKAALAAANSDPLLDRVVIGPGTFTAPTVSGYVTGFNPVQVVGSGAGVTTLTGPAGTDLVLYLGNHDSLVSDLSVEMPADNSNFTKVGIHLGHGSARRVSVSAPSGPAGRIWPTCPL